MAAPPMPDQRLGTTRGVQIRGWGESSDVAYCAQAGTTHKVDASAGELLRWLSSAPNEDGVTFAETAEAFDGLIAPSELAHLVDELAVLGLVWRRSLAA
ncbi:MAG: hypothetical protein ACOVOT_02285 [Rubrivivax sp.]|jgi:hypothetical protein|nr:hypothetical protein [Rubrivivax sp.]